MINFLFYGALLLAFILFLQLIIGLISAVVFGIKIGFGEAFETGFELSKGSLFIAMIMAIIASTLISSDVLVFPDSWIPKDRFGGTDDFMAGIYLYFGCFAIVYIPSYIYSIIEIAKHRSYK